MLGKHTLCRYNQYRLEQVRGIEPLCPTWKDGVMSAIRHLLVSPILRPVSRLLEDLTENATSRIYCVGAISRTRTDNIPTQRFTIDCVTQIAVCTNIIALVITLKDCTTWNAASRIRVTSNRIIGRGICIPLLCIDLIPTSRRVGETIKSTNHIQTRPRSTRRRGRISPNSCTSITKCRSLRISCTTKS
jgi:hypothetical protein